MVSLLVAIAAGVDVVMVVMVMVVVAVCLAEGICRRQAQCASLAPLAYGLRVAVAVEDVVRLLGVEDILARDRQAPCPDVLAQSCLHIPVVLERALCRHAARAVASRSLESHAPRQAYGSHAVYVPHQPVLLVAMYGIEAVVQRIVCAPCLEMAVVDICRGGQCQEAG